MDVYRSLMKPLRAALERYEHETRCMPAIRPTVTRFGSRWAEMGRPRALHFSNFSALSDQIWRILISLMHSRRGKRKGSRQRLQKSRSVPKPRGGKAKSLSTELIILRGCRCRYILVCAQRSGSATAPAGVRSLSWGERARSVAT